MAIIAFCIDDDLVELYQNSASDAIVLTLCRGDSINGYGWNTSARLEYLQAKNIHEGPHRAYSHVWQTIYKTIKPVAAIDVSHDGVTIDVTKAVQCDEEYLTCGACKFFSNDRCSINERRKVDSLKNAMRCIEYRQADC